MPQHTSDIIICCKRAICGLSGDLLQIKQNLLVNPGLKLEDIREVHLTICFIALSTSGESTRSEAGGTEDTALSARHRQQHRSKHIAAIARYLAADLFGLDV